MDPDGNAAEEKRSTTLERLYAAKQRAKDSGSEEPLAQVSECFLELAAIIDEQQRRIEDLERSATGGVGG